MRTIPSLEDQEKKKNFEEKKEALKEKGIDFAAGFFKLFWNLFTLMGIGVALALGAYFAMNVFGLAFPVVLVA